MTNKNIKEVRVSDLFKNLDYQKNKKLWYQGQIPNSNLKRLAIIGTRNPSHYGISVCKEIISKLKNLPVCIISGLAYGIDSLAHEESLRNKITTIAIPGSGLNKEVLYPQSKIKLAQEIIANNGCLISPFAPDQISTTWTFPVRNELIALLSDYLLIIEAGQKSGTLITADFALNQNKTIVALPGNINSPKSEGCNYLIKEGAEILTNTDDICEILGLKKVGQSIAIDNLTKDELTILNLLRQNIDKTELSLHLTIPQENINVIVTSLEIKELI